MNKFITFMLTIACTVSFVLPAAAENVTIVGTGDGVAVLKAVARVFSKENPGVTITVPESIGSGGGIKAVGKGEYTLGRVARKIKEKEAHLGLSYKPFAKIPVVFFVNPSVNVIGISVEQVIDIYSGKITNWKEVGGKDAKVRVVRREQGDSSLKTLRKTFPGFRDIVFTRKSKTAFKTPQMVSIVSTKAGTIGFGPYDVAIENGLNVLNIDGKAPFDVDYPSLSTMGLIFKEENNTGTVKSIIDFITSTAANNAITSAGGVGI